MQAKWASLFETVTIKNAANAIQHYCDTVRARNQTFPLYIISSLDFFKPAWEDVTLTNHSGQESRHRQRKNPFGIITACTFFRQLGLPKEMVELLCPFVSWVTFLHGDFVYHSNEPSDACYLLLTGQVNILIAHSVKAIFEGQIFGETGILRSGVRGSDAVVKSDLATALKINILDFHAAGRAYLALQLLQALRARGCDRTPEMDDLVEFSVVDQLPIFDEFMATLKSKPKDIISKAIFCEALPKGAQIYKAGDPCEYFYIVFSGAVEEVQKGIGTKIFTVDDSLKISGALPDLKGRTGRLGSIGTFIPDNLLQRQDSFYDSVGVMDSHSEITTHGVPSTGHSELALAPEDNSSNATQATLNFSAILSNSEGNEEGSNNTKFYMSGEYFGLGFGPKCANSSKMFETGILLKVSKIELFRIKSEYAREATDSKISLLRTAFNLTSEGMPEYLTRLANYFTEQRYEPGRILADEGKAVDSIFIVVNGRIEECMEISVQPNTEIPQANSEISRVPIPLGASMHSDCVGLIQALSVGGKSTISKWAGQCVAVGALKVLRAPARKVLRCLEDMGSKEPWREMIGLRATLRLEKIENALHALASQGKKPCEADAAGLEDMQHQLQNLMVRHNPSSAVTEHEKLLQDRKFLGARIYEIQTKREGFMKTIPSLDLFHPRTNAKNPLRLDNRAGFERLYPLTLSRSIKRFSFEGCVIPVPTTSTRRGGSYTSREGSKFPPGCWVSPRVIVEPNAWPFAGYDRLRMSKQKSDSLKADEEELNVCNFLPAIPLNASNKSKEAMEIFMSIDTAVSKGSKTHQIELEKSFDSNEML